MFPKRQKSSVNDGAFSESYRNTQRHDLSGDEVEAEDKKDNEEESEGEAEEDQSEYGSFVHYCAAIGDLRLLKRFMERESCDDTKRKKYAESYNDYLLTPLHYACGQCAASEGLGVLDYLITNCHGDVNIKGGKGISCLHYAAMNDNAVCAKKLLRHGANLNACTDSGISVLLYAARHCGLPFIQTLVEGGVDLGETVAGGADCLVIAVRHGRVEVVEYLLSVMLEQWEERAEPNAPKPHERVLSEESSCVPFVAGDWSSANIFERDPVLMLNAVCQALFVGKYECLMTLVNMGGLSREFRWQKTLNYIHMLFVLSTLFVDLLSTESDITKMRYWMTWLLQRCIDYRIDPSVNNVLFPAEVMPDLCHRSCKEPFQQCLTLNGYGNFLLPNSDSSSTNSKSPPSLRALCRRAFRQRYAKGTQITDVCRKLELPAHLWDYIDQHRDYEQYL
eukprot:Nk52_evm1s1606 gene=Nk52_evmTU1s1606